MAQAEGITSRVVGETRVQVSVAKCDKKTRCASLQFSQFNSNKRSFSCLFFDKQVKKTCDLFHSRAGVAAFSWLLFVERI